MIDRDQQDRKLWEASDVSIPTTLPLLGAAAALLAYFVARLSAAQSAKVPVRVETRRRRPTR
ncbi:hypothetical protein [Sphingomonas sp.]|uniref:hypothetical protein n=1 Tax=Sphingomonas sp. TaxID=28214 RepID=UPI002DD68792|nr:hypothetical protein [Sphingomonas sp.]